MRPFLKTPFLSAITLSVAVSLLLCSCVGFSVKIRPGHEEGLKEFTLEGKERGKVLVIPIRGFLSDSPKKGLLGERPSTVQEIVSQLRKAAKDDEIKAVLLEIDSPGGTITASDMLYHEIMQFKERTKARVVAALMDVAASGGYYVALTADRIVAHPTTVTGSIGVVLIKPKVTGLMEKLGVAVEVSKSGSEKDIGSPFRPSTAEEQKIFQELIDRLAGRFLRLVVTRRNIGPQAMANVSTARIYLAEEALQLKLIDGIGYMNDAVRDAKSLANLPKEAKVVVYRRSKHADDNLYNTSTSHYGGAMPPLIDLHVTDIIPSLNQGFYYLWLPGSKEN